MVDGNDVGFMNAHKLMGRQNFFHLVHRLVRDQGIVGAMNSQIILHAFHKNDFRKVHLEELAARLDEDMVGVFGQFSNGLRIQPAIRDLIDGFRESFEADWF